MTFGLNLTFILTGYFSPFPGQLSLVAIPTRKTGEAARICPIYYPYCLDLSQQDSPAEIKNQKFLKHTDLISVCIRYESLFLLLLLDSTHVPAWYLTQGSVTVLVPSTLILSLGYPDVSSLLVMPIDAKEI